MKEKEKIKLTFLGTGTSQGVPVIACGCEVCKSSNSKDKRLRSSVMFTINDINIVVDTGPDFRQQMLRENVENIHGIIFTHSHKDHTAGLDDVRAFNFKHNKNIDIYCEVNVLESLSKEFSYIFDESFAYPGIPRINSNIISESVFTIDNIEILPIRGLHYKLPVLGFRIGDVAYITDMNLIEDSELKKLNNLDVLVINALRKEAHVSHFSLSEALEIIETIKPKASYLTHISHNLGLAKEVSKELPDNVFLGYDGLVV